MAPTQGQLYDGWAAASDRIPRKDEVWALIGMLSIDGKASDQHIFFQETEEYFIFERLAP